MCIQVSIRFCKSLAGTHTSRRSQLRKRDTSLAVSLSSSSSSANYLTITIAKFSKKVVGALVVRTRSQVRYVRTYVAQFAKWVSGVCTNGTITQLRSPARDAGITASINERNARREWRRRRRRRVDRTRRLLAHAPRGYLTYLRVYLRPGL